MNARENMADKMAIPPRCTRGPVQVKADLDVTFDLRRAEVQDQDAVPSPDVEVACAGPATQALGDAVIGVQVLDGPGFGRHRGVHVVVLRFASAVSPSDAFALIVS
jgi:hypothetical protein